MGEQPNGALIRHLRYAIHHLCDGPNSISAQLKLKLKPRAKGPGISSPCLLKAAVNGIEMTIEGLSYAVA
ncbi:uncharacterized protein LOC116802147 [Drosophila sechellia]|uniref:uncharacterized protein LOC116802147 n=1 Tax=Drosophila sechellia TaxID=7238 RepID=UPI0013DE453B|nr:uncharacterized protein LOC116802147 [Drosophila sechellia]